MQILSDSCSLVGPGILENVKPEMAPETPSPHCPSLQREPQSFWQDHSPALQLMRPGETHGEHHIHQKPHYPNQKQRSETVRTRELTSVSTGTRGIDQTFCAISGTDRHARVCALPTIIPPQLEVLYGTVRLMHHRKSHRSCTVQM